MGRYDHLPPTTSPFSGFFTLVPRGSAVVQTSENPRHGDGRCPSGPNLSVRSALVKQQELTTWSIRRVKSRHPANPQPERAPAHDVPVPPHPPAEPARQCGHSGGRPAKSSAGRDAYSESFSLRGGSAARSGPRGRAVRSGVLPPSRAPEPS